MSRIPFAILVFSVIAMTKSDSNVDVQSKPMITDPSKSTLDTISKQSETVGKYVADLAIDHFLPTNAFTLTITNNMVSSRLIDPRIYIDSGHTVSPPPFILPAATALFSGTRQMVLLENDPAGILCYGNEDVKKHSNSRDIDVCVAFNAGEKKYGVHIEYNKMTGAGMKKLYREFKKGKSIFIYPTEHPYGGFLYTDYKLFQVLAQMTSGKEKLQLHLEVTDIFLKSREAFLQKRVAIFSGLALGGLQSLATLAFNRITADVGTTLILENESTEYLPVVLFHPRWEQNGVKLNDIVPWRIGPKESSEITLVGPLGAGKTFDRSAIALSFKIQGTNDRIVFTIWWPMKFSFSKDLNSYSVSWLTVPKSGRNSDEDQILRGALKNFVELADEGPEKFPTPVIAVDNFQRYKIWQFPISNSVNGRIDKFLNVVTSMSDARKNGMRVKVYATGPARLNPSPKDYTGLPNEVPPV